MEPIEGESREARLSKDARGRRTINQYTILRKLGHGACGKVKLAQARQELFAVKVIHKDVLRRQREFIIDSKGQRGVKNALQDALNEISIMKRLKHANVVQLREVLHDTREKLYLGEHYTVMDYCGKGPILQWNAREQRFTHAIEGFGGNEVDEDRLRDVFRQMVNGLHYRKRHSVHSSRILHRDIKPQNILQADSGFIKFADFGQATQFDTDDGMTKTAGTLHFFPPESCGQEKGKFSGQAADIWALGLTLYALVYLRLPFNGECFADIIRGITTFQLEFPRSPDISPQLKSLIGKMLEKDPQRRAPMSELLTDPWAFPEERRAAPEKSSDSIISIDGISFSV